MRAVDLILLQGSCDIEYEEESTVLLTRSIAESKRERESELHFHCWLGPISRASSVRMKQDRPIASSSVSHSGLPTPEREASPQVEVPLVRSRGGSPRLELNGTTSTALEAMDLSVPQLRRRKSLDRGYDGEIRREPKGEQEIARGLLQKSYLSGELVSILVKKK